jgi:hypothetical protein
MTRRDLPHVDLYPLGPIDPRRPHRWDTTERDRCMSGLGRAMLDIALCCYGEQTCTHPEGTPDE